MYIASRCDCTTKDHAFNILMLIKQFSLIYSSFNVSVKLEAVAWKCFIKKALVFREIFQNPQGNTCTGVSFLTNLQDHIRSLIKKDSQTGVFGRIEEHIHDNDHIPFPVISAMV